ncbi:regulatory helix-turn-helix protein, lysR family [Aliiruegeria lutimaris]|uniref:Regulatory helix-turn-helix protein, lysR family n=1 Tax=Aliiruegeria lutimaris TaxID=571298 RepID=A0A1G9AES1_9RHOB|nr:regulatory helix-turn-helix protein, lysR family [Aliiruegeria lutimaris]
MQGTPQSSHSIRSDLPTLRNLRIFEAVSRLGSITGAASEVHLSQPAVTQAIANIESQIGARLFDRRNQGTFLTADGLIFEKRVRRYYAQIERGLRDFGKRDYGKNLAVLLNLISEPQIRCLIAISEAESFAQAAQAINLSETTLSRSARDLQGTLKSPALFRRTATSMTCSLAGRELARRFKLARREISLACEEIDASRGHARSRISLGVLPLGGTSITGHAVSEFCRRHPDVRFELVEGHYDVLLGMLRSASIDFIIGMLRNPAPESDVVEEYLLADPYVVAVRKTHPLADKTDVSKEALAECRWILPKGDTPRRRAFEKAFSNLSELPTVDIETSSTRHIRTILRQSDRASILTRVEMLAESGAEGLVGIPLALPRATGKERIIGTTRLLDQLRTPYQTEFLDLLRDIARTI